MHHSSAMLFLRHLFRVLCRLLALALGILALLRTFVRAASRSQRLPWIPRRSSLFPRFPFRW